MAEYNDGFKAGQIDARQEDHDRRLASIEAKVDAQGKKIDSLLESMAVARGGYRVLLSVGVISAGATGIITELVHWISRVSK